MAYGRAHFPLSMSAITLQQLQAIATLLPTNTSALTSSSSAATNHQSTQISSSSSGTMPLTPINFTTSVEKVTAPLYTVKAEEYNTSLKGFETIAGMAIALRYITASKTNPRNLEALLQLVCVIQKKQQSISPSDLSDIFDLASRLIPNNSSEQAVFMLLQIASLLRKTQKSISYFDLANILGVINNDLVPLLPSTPNKQAAYLLHHILNLNPPSYIYVNALCELAFLIFTKQIQIAPADHAIFFRAPSAELWANFLDCLANSTKIEPLWVASEYFVTIPTPSTPQIETGILHTQAAILRGALTAITLLYPAPSNTSTLSQPAAVTSATSTTATPTTAITNLNAKKRKQQEGEIGTLADASKKNRSDASSFDTTQIISTLTQANNQMMIPAQEQHAAEPKTNTIPSTFHQFLRFLQEAHMLPLLTEPTRAPTYQTPGNRL